MNTRTAGAVLELEQPLALGAAPWQTPDRITCHMHDTLIEHCIEEHGLELLEPLTFYRLGSERTR